MSKMFRRFIRVTVALIAAIFLGSLTLLFLSPLAGDAIMDALFRFLKAMMTAGNPMIIAAFTIVAIGKLLLLITVVPIVVIGLIGEVAGWRSGLWYVTGTAIITAAIPFLLRASFSTPTPGELRVSAYLATAGMVSGTIYWLIAGSRQKNTIRDEQGAH